METRCDQIVELFAEFQNVLEEEDSMRERVRQTTNKMDQTSREFITSLQVIHLEKSSNQLTDVLNKAESLITKQRELYGTLAALVPANEFYKYHDMWKIVTQRVVFEVALYHFLKTGGLASREFVASQLSIKSHPTQGFHLHLDDYLYGLLQLASELARFAVTSATAGDYSRPIQISNFVSELNAGFRLLNFKNDALRKRFDVMKYDLKKIEEVVYDLSIRGLKQNEPENKMEAN